MTARAAGRAPAAVPAGSRRAGGVEFQRTQFQDLNIMTDRAGTVDIGVAQGGAEALDRGVSEDHQYTFAHRGRLCRSKRPG